MTDIVTYCDVNTCEECPRYGDDCDGGGDAEMDNCQVQVPQNYMQQSRHDDGTDLISRADAIEAVRGLSVLVDDKDYSYFEDALKALPSADAVPQLKQTDTLIIADALRYLAQDTERHELDRTRAEELREQILRYGASMCSSADAVQGYTEWLEKIIVDNEGANEWLCEDTPDLEWCEKNCHYSSIQAECLRHLYEVRKGGDDE